MSPDTRYEAPGRTTSKPRPPKADPAPCRWCRAPLGYQRVGDYCCRACANEALGEDRP